MKIILFYFIRFVYNLDGLLYFKVECSEIDLNRKIVHFWKINKTNDFRHFASN